MGTERKQASYSLHDYVKNNRNSFDQQGFNNADGAVLTQISNMNFDGAGIDVDSGNSMSIAELYKAVENTNQYKNMPPNDQQLLAEMASSPRYKDMVVSNYVHDPVKNNVDGFPSIGNDSSSEQFAAVTISYKQDGKTTNYMSFRATDGSDDGWNEDFLMLSSTKTQAQSDSVAYMNIVGRKLEGDFVGGGHSKGGNDFEYGYLYCDDEVRSKFTAGYMYDSPGLQDELIENNPHYDDLQRISDGHFVCPQDAMVGMLLHENKNPVFVHSVESNFNEHDPYSWEIDPETGEFVETEQSELSKYVNSLIDEAVENMDDKERAALSRLISFIIYNDDMDTEGLESFKAYFIDKDGKIRSDKVGELFGYIMSLPPEQRKKLLESVGAILGGFVVMSVGYAVEKFEEWVEKAIDRVKKAIESATVMVTNWVKLRAQEVKDLFENIYNATVATISKINNWWNKNFNGGYKYATANPFIKVDTYRLRNYAQRIQSVNRRIANLDRRLDSLYWRAGLLDLWNLMQADALTGYSWRLTRSAAYLNDTASDFESSEKNITNSL